MARKNPTLYLTNGKKQYCSLCECDLLLTELEFPMLQIKGDKSIAVRENVLFCPCCRKYYITQEMSRQIVHRHPGYYVDTSLYNLKSSKPQKNKTYSEGKSKSSEIQINPDTQLIHSTTPNTLTYNSEKSLPATPVSEIKAEVYLSNTYATENNICPICRNILYKESVNIPVIGNNGDFYRYYVDRVKYCNKCKKAFVSKNDVTSILAKINSISKYAMTVKLENVIIHHTEHTDDYLFSPTIGNDYAIFIPRQDKHEAESFRSDNMSLNAQSFLGEMGYSVNKGVDTRHYILTEAIKKYGKRRVCDHIAFLIATRKAQKEGNRKFAHALHIWQNDLNYISSLPLSQSIK